MKILNKLVKCLVFLLFFSKNKKTAHTTCLKVEVILDKQIQKIDRNLIEFNICNF